MMRIPMHVCPTKFLFARRTLNISSPRILDIGCGNNSPSTTKHWFKNCHYSGADIQQYNMNERDLSVMDDFYPLGEDGSGYDAIPENSFDFIVLNHVVEHMPDPLPIIAKVCSKLKAGGFIWIAFPSPRSLSLPSAEGSLHFCDDPTHIYMHDIKEVSNILLANNVKVVHAGRSKDAVRMLLGIALIPIAISRKLLTGRFSGQGLWYILGFEDHVFGQRRGKTG